MKPLLLTLGDPGGLGPELACMLASQLGELAASRPLALVGSPASLEVHARRMGLKPFWRPASSVAGLESGVHLLAPPELDEREGPALGEATVQGGRVAGFSLRLACDALMAGQAAGLVTGPLNKAMLNGAGFAFAGHTEFLAHTAGLAQDDVTMHLCGPRLRVSLVTTHPPLAAVPGLITRKRVARAIRHTAGFCGRLGLTAPVGVCGLNPHAGESGTIGTEEVEIITPAVEEAKAMGLNVSGPWPADTVFPKAAAGEFSAVVAMYHDQGLGPLKLLHFGEAVNVTLGLPFVRTSVDHGTGYDVVGTGRASPASLEAALNLALELVGAEAGG